MSVGDDTKHPEGSTHLNSHANMVVVGKICLIISYSDHSAVVSGFTQEIGTVQVPIVGAVIAYEDEYQAGKIYYLVVRNALYVKTLKHNLIPPFVMRKAGLEVNERAKIHSYPPCKEDHSILNPKSDFHIHLKLDGIFSYFDSRAP